jgi:hypothetical protein
MTMIRLLAAGCAGAAMASAVASSAFAANNNPPPPGAILDLAGTAIPHTPSQAYTVDFTASLANTAVSFAFRDDPAYLFFSNVSVTNLTTPSGNLLTNGDFSAGTYGASLPNGWTYQNTDGAAFQGRVTTSCGGPAFCWEDGSTQAYDLLSPDDLDEGRRPVSDLVRPLGQRSIKHVPAGEHERRYDRHRRKRGRRPRLRDRGRQSQRSRAFDLGDDGPGLRRPRLRRPSRAPVGDRRLTETLLSSRPQGRSSSGLFLDSPRSSA